MSGDSPTVKVVGTVAVIGGMEVGLRLLGVAVRVKLFFGVNGGPPDILASVLKLSHGFIDEEGWIRGLPHDTVCRVTVCAPTISIGDEVVIVPCTRPNKTPLQELAEGVWAEDYEGI